MSETYKINDMFLDEKFKEPDFSNLNEEQYQAVMHDKGPALVIAGAGTGKTTVITNRLAHLVYKGVPASAILLVTFTNKAAREMLDRAKKMLGNDDVDVRACTYHAFCANMLRKYSKYAKVSKDFTILDSVDTVDTMNLLKEAHGFGKDKTFPKGSEVIGILSDCSTKDYDLYEYLSDLKPPYLEHIDKIKTLESSYDRYKRENNLMDYEDLLLRFLNMLKEYPEIAKEISDTYEYIMVDEYQDSNLPQMKILKELRNKGNDNLMVVGDDFQSIYRFRGAEVENILNFPKQWPGCEMIVLKQNYRSNQSILDFSNAITRQAKEKFTKDLVGNRTDGMQPMVVNVDTQDTEARFIISKIYDFHKAGMPYKKMAAIIRGSNDSINLEQLLTKYRIPFQKFGGIKFLERVFVKNILAFLKVYVNDKDEISWFRIFQLYPNIGKANAKLIATAIKENGIEELKNSKYSNRVYGRQLPLIYDAIGRMKKLSLREQIEYLIDYIYELNKDVIINSKKNDTAKTDALKENDANHNDAKLLVEMTNGYIDAISFLTDITLEAPTSSEDGDYFNITTVHSAKGLEYDVVFIVCCIDGTFPWDKDPKFPTPAAIKNHIKELEEERRIFYVAITRAKTHLFMTIPNRIFKYGSTDLTSPSRFLTDSKDVIKTYGEITIE